jgi:hypothetical protein
MIIGFLKTMCWYTNPIHERAAFCKQNYRVSIKLFPDYKHLLQENYNCNKRSTCWSVLICCKKSPAWVELYFEKNIYVCIPRSFFVINVCNQEKTLCSPCITLQFKTCICIQSCQRWQGVCPTLPNFLTFAFISLVSLLLFNAILNTC